MRESRRVVSSHFFFFNDTATTEIYTLSLHDALPISPSGCALAGQPDALAVLDAGRDPHRDGAGLRGDPVAVAGRAGVVDDLPGAAAVAARLGERERALAAAGDPGALAHRAGVRAGAGTRPVAVEIGRASCRERV